MFVSDQQTCVSRQVHLSQPTLSTKSTRHGQVFLIWKSIFSPHFKNSNRCVFSSYLQAYLGVHSAALSLNISLGTNINAVAFGIFKMYWFEFFNRRKIFHFFFSSSSFAKVPITIFRTLPFTVRITNRQTVMSQSTRQI